jgi:hypothetical protein
MSSSFLYLTNSVDEDTFLEPFWLDCLMELQRIGITQTKESFIRELATQLPKGTAPVVDSVDGSIIGISWPPTLAVSIAEDDEVAVSDFSSGDQEFQYFENYRDSIPYIVKCYAALQAHMYM